VGADQVVGILSLSLCWLGGCFDRHEIPTPQLNLHVPTTGRSKPGPPHLLAKGPKPCPGPVTYTGDPPRAGCGSRAFSGVGCVGFPCYRENQAQNGGVPTCVWALQRPGWECNRSAGSPVSPQRWPKCWKRSVRGCLGGWVRRPLFHACWAVLLAWALAPHCKSPLGQ